MKMMKKAIALLLAVMMVLSLAACGSSDNRSKDNHTENSKTAQEVLDTLKAALGDSYGCDLAEDEDRMTNYYGLDMSKIDSWAAESSENSALDPSIAVVLQVKDGYAEDAAALLQTGAGEDAGLQQDVRHEPAHGAAGPAVRQRQLCGAADPGADAG